jgi:hypothetical protein
MTASWVFDDSSSVASDRRTDCIAPAGVAERLDEA